MANEKTRVNFPLLRYFAPKHSGLYKESVIINKALMIGDIGTGKTTTALTIFNIINKLYDNYEQINIYTDDWDKLINIHKNNDVLEKVKKAEIINILFDDAGTTLSSRSYTIEKIANWFTIRHYFMEQISKKSATINFIFAIQRFKSLANFIRGNTAQIIWKAYPVTDPDDEKEINMLTRGNAKLLQFWAYKIHYDQDYRYMSKNLVVPILYSPYIINIPPQTASVERIELKKEKVCRICNGREYRYGLCRKHYRKWQNAGEPDIEEFINKAKMYGMYSMF